MAFWRQQGILASLSQEFEQINNTNTIALFSLVVTYCEPSFQRLKGASRDLGSTANERWCRFMHIYDSVVNAFKHNMISNDARAWSGTERIETLLS